VANQPALEIEGRHGSCVRGELLEHFESYGLPTGWPAVFAGIELRHDFLSEAEVVREEAL
jgi:hypothetical protein